MKNLFLYIIAGLFLFPTINAQNDTIFKALEDEIHRNMTQLKRVDDHPDPFFLEYRLSDYRYDVIYGSLGSVTRENYSNKRSSNVRLMVGNYDISDENFKDPSVNIYHNDGNFPLPLENDYWAIRRSYWLSTNNVFKSASELYKNKISAMKLKGLTKEDLPAPDFSREEVVIKKEAAYDNDFDREQGRNIIQNLSAGFRSYSDLDFSQASLFHMNAYNYVVNSEGSKISFPFKLYILHIAAVKPDAENHMVWQQLIYYARDFNDFPTENQMLEDIDALVTNIRNEAEAEKYDEKYFGPVLYEGFSVVEDNFIKLFRSSAESLIASRTPLVNDLKDGAIIQSKPTWEQRLDKKVVDKKISIYDISAQKKYHNEKLLGTFNIDVQAVIPGEQLVLVENGILKNQLVNRTPTGRQLKSTGHERMGISSSGLLTDIAPGVIHIKANEAISGTEMKDKLIELGKEEGLDYVIYAHSLDVSANSVPVNYFKLDVNTGEATMLRKVKDLFDVNDLRNIVYVSDTENVFNTLFYLGVSGHTRGFPVTFITPGEIIVNEKQISGDANTIKGELPIVPSPLMKDN